MAGRRNHRYWGFRGAISRKAYLANQLLSLSALAAIAFYRLDLAPLWRLTWLDGVAVAAVLGLLLACLGNFTRRVQDVRKTERFSLLITALVFVAFLALAFLNPDLGLLANFWLMLQPGRQAAGGAPALAAAGGAGIPKRAAA